MKHEQLIKLGKAFRSIAELSGVSVDSVTYSLTVQGGNISIVMEDKKEITPVKSTGELFGDSPQPLENQRKTVPEAGANSYVVTNEQTKKYTVIGADNIHHAQNKATKLFGAGWSSIHINGMSITNQYKMFGYSFLPPRQFSALLRLLRTS